MTKKLSFLIPGIFLFGLLHAEEAAEPQHTVDAYTYVTCESFNGESHYCYVDGPVVEAELLQEYDGDNRCVPGQTFAWTSNYLVVGNDCAGYFRVKYHVED